MILFELFITFFKIGLFTIGGGYAMIPLITREVEQNGWIASNEIVNFIAIAESTPGPFAVNIATFIGMKTGSFFGAICATMGVVLPSFIIILIIAKYFHKFSEQRVVKSALSGLRPTVIGLMLSTVFTISASNFIVGIDKIVGFSEFFASHINYKGIVIFAIVFLLSRKFKLHPILIVAISAGLGIVLFGLLTF